LSLGDKYGECARSARVLDHRALHAQEYPEERDAALACALRGDDLAFDAALAEAPGTRMASTSASASRIASGLSSNFSESIARRC